MIDVAINPGPELLDEDGQPYFGFSMWVWTDDTGQVWNQPFASSGDDETDLARGREFVARLTERAAR